MLSRILLRAVARSRRRGLVAAVAGAVVGLALTRAGWPWWAALPAGLLSMVVAFVSVVTVLYAYTKRNYPRRAEEVKARMGQARTAAHFSNDGWQPKM
jgi:zinc transporter ZupT